MARLSHYHITVKRDFAKLKLDFISTKKLQSYTSKVFLNKEEIEFLDIQESGLVSYEISMFLPNKFTKDFTPIVIDCYNHNNFKTFLSKLNTLIKCGTDFEIHGILVTGAHSSSVHMVSKNHQKYFLLCDASRSYQNDYFEQKLSNVLGIEFTNWLTQIQSDSSNCSIFAIKQLKAIYKIFHVEFKLRINPHILQDIIEGKKKEYIDIHKPLQGGPDFSLEEMVSVISNKTREIKIGKFLNETFQEYVEIHSVFRTGLNSKIQIARNLYTLIKRVKYLEIALKNFQIIFENLSDPVNQAVKYLELLNLTDPLMRLDIIINKYYDIMINRIDLYKEWSMYSKFLGKVLIVNGAPSLAKATLTEAFTEFGYNKICVDSIMFPLILELSKKILFSSKVEEVISLEDFNKMLSKIKCSDEQKIELRLQITDAIYTMVRPLIFSGQNVYIDIVISSYEEHSILTYSFQHYPKTNLLVKNQQIYSEVSPSKLSTPELQWVSCH